MKNNRYIKQGILLTLTSLLVAIFSFVKEAVFAEFYGVSAAADAFTVAVVIPEILFAVVWEGINASVIPIYTDKFYKEGKKVADSFIASVLVLIFGGTIVLLLLMEGVAEGLVYVFSPGLQPETHELAVQLTRFVLPVLLFEGVERICNCVLQINGQFTAAKFLNVIRNVSITIFIVCLASTHGIVAAVYGFLSGVIIETVIYFLFSSRYINLSNKPSLNRELFDRLRKVLLPIFIGVGVGELNQIADKMVASFLDEGSISALNYASKLSSMIQTLLLINVITIMYPEFSKLAAQKEYKALAKAYLKTIEVCILICVPLVFGGCFLKNELVSLAFERGNFDKSSVIRVAILFTIYLVSAFFLMIQQVGVKLFIALGDTKTPMIGSVVGVIINVISNVVFSRYYGAVGIAFATVVSAVVTSGIIMVLSKKKLPYFSFNKIFLLFIKAGISAMGMFVVLAKVQPFIFNGVWDTIGHKMRYSIYMVGIGSIVYLGVLFLLARKDIVEMVGRKR